ncbi:MAG: energy transducer TonB [Terracidiphilus sp.]|jgi:protein TonB
MKTIVCLLLSFAIKANFLLAQSQATSRTEQPFEVQILRGVAEKLLVHKADVICPRIAMPAHVIGTVVVAIEINRNGDVLHPKVISGPAMLQKRVLDAVRKYKYKPYLLNGTAIDVETTVAVTLDSNLDCHFE